MVTHFDLTLETAPRHRGLGEGPLSNLPIPPYVCCWRDLGSVLGTSLEGGNMSGE